MCTAWCKTRTLLSASFVRSELYCQPSRRTIQKQWHGHAGRSVCSDGTTTYRRTSGLEAPKPLALLENVENVRRVNLADWRVHVFVARESERVGGESKVSCFERKNVSRFISSVVQSA